MPDDARDLSRRTSSHGGERALKTSNGSPVHLPKMQHSHGGRNVATDEDPPARRRPPAGAAAAAPIGSRRSDGSTARGSSGRGLSRFPPATWTPRQIFPDVSSVHSSKEPSPLPTPEVSNTGRTRRGCSSRINRSSVSGGGAPTAAPDEQRPVGGDGSIGAESDDRLQRSHLPERGARAEGGSGMHRSASVVSFRGDGGRGVAARRARHRERHDLKKEKKGKKSSTFKWLKKEASALAYEFGLKKRRRLVWSVDAKLKESRRNMVDNLTTRAHNEGRRAWETRDVSLRGGGEFFHADAVRRSASPKLQGGTTGLDDGDEADSPMSLPDGLERFTREENE